MDFLLLVATAVALVWGTILLRAGGLLTAAVGVLAAGIVFGHPFFNVSVGPLPITIDRLLLGALLAMTLVYRRLGRTERHPLAKADAALVGFVLVLGLSTFLHDWQRANAQPAATLLFLVLMPVVMYWIARQVPVSQRALWGLFAALGLFGFYLAVTAIAETHGLWWLVYPKYIASTEFVEFYGRGRGPLFNPAGSGILQGLCLAGALMGWSRLGRRGQLLLLALMPIYAWGIYCTYTRSAWMGAMAGMFVVVALTLPRSWRTAVLGTLLLVSVPVAVWNWESFLSFKRDKSLSAEEAAESARLRPILAAVAWQMFLDRPWLGCGFGQYILECRPYLSDRSIDLPLEAVRPYVQHNVLLALLVETGLVGVSLFVMTLGLWLREAWHLWRASAAPPAARELGLLFLAFVGVWLPNAMFQDVSLIPMVNMLLLFLAGLTMNVALTVAERAGGTLPVASAPLAAGAGLVDLAGVWQLKPRQA